MPDNNPRSEIPKPVVLCVLDGWGWRPDSAENAIALADTPNFDRLMRDCPNAHLKTSGTDVGLPAGQMGNSEVGHLNLGAGRVVDQDIRRVDAAIADGSLGANPALAGLIGRLKESGGTCHLMGLISPGGVHSHQDQIAALARIVAAAGIPVAVHAFLDGRDTPPRSAPGFMRDFVDQLADCDNLRIATISGRYYPMDRDRRWERVAAAYDMLVSAVSAGAARADNPIAAIEASYAADTGDEFMLPTAIGDYAGMRDGDGILMGNFRADRAREILLALLDPKFEGFTRDKPVNFAAAAGLVAYSSRLAELMTALFPPVKLARIFADVLVEKGLKQLRVAETEKYAHVTFFFNGGVEEPFPGEDRILIPSPRVATYDEQPEMSAAELTNRLVDAVGSGNYDFILVNYANPDMVGHTGILAAAIKAIEVVDQCLGRLEEAVRDAGGALFITADHGNAETMTDPETGKPFTSHTTNVVPAILVGGPSEALDDGRLADVAPTLLALMRLDQPKEMTGHSLIPTDGPSGDGMEREAVPAPA